ncbi:MAG: hypothetical protein KatS3mg104_1969 [Phycisphaerae bacterium]|jgi:hypothetical protein|nr:MAG: hypothetical protein KatS3mg104_1969 [Phycisphaerae bacterium]
MPENDASELRSSRFLTYTPGQRRVLIVLLGIMSVYVISRRISNPVSVSDPQPSEGVRAFELADRIDPEYADWQTLAILPGIGETRAKMIVSKRTELQNAKPNRRAFTRAEDLYLIKGIGPATLERIQPYLIFPSDPTTMPEAY